MRAIPLFLAVYLVVSLGAFAEVAVPPRTLPAWCNSVLATPQKLSKAIRRYAGGEARIFHVTDEEGRDLAEKIYVRHAGLEHTEQGLHSFFEVALQEYFTLNFVREFMAKNKIRILVPKVYSVSETNRRDIVTEEDGLFVAKNEIAPTLLRDFVEGDTVEGYIQNEDVPIDWRVKTVKEFNAYLRKVQRAITKSYPPEQIVENKVLEYESYHLPVKNDRDREMMVDVLHVTIKGVSGSLLTGEALHFSLYPTNLVVDLKNDLEMIDSQ